MERPIEERVDFLGAVTGGDDALRREVESLLESDTSDGCFLDHLPVASGRAPLLSLSRPASMDHVRSHTALTSGVRVGAFEILAPLGAGAMGDVYRACDTNLNREVALKVLPALFALDPDRLARFKREAQVLATLSHPNIAAIYGLEESNGAPALVLELVEGRRSQTESHSGRFRRERPWPSRVKSPKPWKRRTKRASFIATSSRPMSRSPAMAWSKCSISGSRRCGTAPQSDCGVTDADSN